MHLYFFMRAIRQDGDRFIRDLESQYFPYEFKDPRTNEKCFGVVQLAVREWGGFYEIVFPEKSLDEVLAMIGRLDSFEGIKYKTIILFLRKLLNCEELPKEIKQTLPRITWRTSHPDIRIYPIGIKKDTFIDGIEQL